MVSMKHYLRPCEAQAFEKYQEKNELIEKGIHVINFEVEECQPDGWYLPVRLDNAKGKKFCADEQGEMIENFEADVDDSEKMHCSKNFDLIESTVFQTISFQSALVLVNS